MLGRTITSIVVDGVISVDKGFHHHLIHTQVTRLIPVFVTGVVGCLTDGQGRLGGIIGNQCEAPVTVSRDSDLQITVASILDCDFTTTIKHIAITENELAPVGIGHLELIGASSNGHIGLIEAIITGVRQTALSTPTIETTTDIESGCAVRCRCG